MNNIIAYHLADHCNLNCSACNHFSPLAESRFADIDKFEKNLSKLSKVIKITELNLMGGEPLLHPEVTEFIKIARKILKTEFISIWTNGMLLNSVSPYFFTEIKKNNICIRETDYGIIKNKFKYKDNRLIKTNWLSVIKNNKWECPFYNSFLNSPMQLNENGDLFYCCIPANIHHYNKYYNMNLITEYNKDYINIFNNFMYKDFIKQKITERPFCYYCRKANISKWSRFSNSSNNWIYNR